MIRRDLPSILKFYSQISLAWILIWILFYLLRHYGVGEYHYLEISREFQVSKQVTTYLIVGIFTGILSGTTELNFEKNYFRKIAYWRLILLKTLVHLLIALILMVLAVISMQWMLYGQMLPELVRSWLISKTFLISLVYFLVFSILISFFRQMNHSFGPGVLWNMLIGKYHFPREENRIFMFLDLRSSSAIAEKLGHIRFSRFIQDCFLDLTDVILRNKVDIYQYVGDEAVLSWSVKNGLQHSHCLKSYFDFLHVLENRKQYYLREYEVHPFFKAGVHLGVVTVAEVGLVKKEIAYHGDVLITAARIQGKCNALGQGLLISQNLREQFSIVSDFRFQEMGRETLKGLRNEMKLFGVQPA